MPIPVIGCEIPEGKGETFSTRIEMKFDPPPPLTSLSPINMKLESPAEIYEIEDDTPNV
jgi:hypothetical protein